MTEIKITSLGYIDFDDPFVNDDTPSNLRAPVPAADGTDPNGMGKARYFAGSWVDEQPPLLADLKTATKKRIDEKAGEIRASYCSPGSLIDQEYRRALDEALAWQAAGEPPASVPSSVQSWATASSLTPSQAAADIVTTGTNMHTALDSIRAARLSGKSAVDAAADAAAIDAAELAAKTELEALRAP